MKRSTLSAALPGVLSLALMAAMGCRNTAEGVKEDAATNVQATQEAAEKTGEAAAQTAREAGRAVSEGAREVGQEASQAARNAGQEVSQAARNADNVAKDAGKEVAGAMAVTPRVKLALTADEQLNDGKNKIDVDTADGVVRLKGTVASQALKERASSIAKKALTEMKSTDKLNNQLQVSR